MCIKAFPLPSGEWLTQFTAEPEPSCTDQPSKRLRARCHARRDSLGRETHQDFNVFFPVFALTKFYSPRDRLSRGMPDVSCERVEGAETQNAGVKIILFPVPEAPFIYEVFANIEAWSVPARSGQKNPLSHGVSSVMILFYQIFSRAGIFSHKVGGVSALRLEESKCHFCLQERHGELQSGQSHLHPWEGVGAANPGNYFQANEGQENQGMGKSSGEVNMDSPRGSHAWPPFYDGQPWWMRGEP